MVDVWVFRYRNLTILLLIMFISFLIFFNVCLQCRPASKIYLYYVYLCVLIHCIIIISYYDYVIIKSCVILYQIVHIIRLFMFWYEYKCIFFILLYSFTMFYPQLFISFPVDNNWRFYIEQKVLSSTTCDCYFMFSIYLSCDVLYSIHKFVQLIAC